MMTTPAPLASPDKPVPDDLFASMAGPRPWLAHYPPGVPADIEALPAATLARLLDSAFARHARRTAFTCLGARMSYARLDALSRAFAAWLQARGMAPGGRVAVMLPNLMSWPVAAAGVIRAGSVLVNVNPLYTARELAHQLADSGAEAIVVLDKVTPSLAEALPATRIRVIVVASAGDLLGPLRGAATDFVLRHVRKEVPAMTLPGAVRLPRALAEGRRLQSRAPDPAPDDVAVLQYTGGTTGTAKGAMLSHRNLLANLAQSRAWLAPAWTEDGQKAVGADHGADRNTGAGADRNANVASATSVDAGANAEPLTVLIALPLYHVFAFTVGALLFMELGGHAVLVPDPRRIDGLVALLKRHRIHVFPAVNTLFRELTRHPRIGEVDFSALRLSIGGGMAVQPSVAADWRRVTGSNIVEGYGLSETSPIVACNPVTTEGFTGSIGLPLPSTAISIRDDDGLTELAHGVPGEICVRGPQVMAGYWNRPAETAQAFTPDGWLRTGDIGVMDGEGRTVIVDRKKDMVLVSGFNVYPNEIEALVAAHPGVAECAVIGVPDEHSGEAVKLVVVRRNAALDTATLTAFCRDRLAGYKRPKIIEFRDVLPKSQVGKVLRRSLRERE